MYKRITVLPINDMPGYQFEVNWTDEDGEVLSEEVKDIDELVETIRSGLVGTQESSNDNTQV